MFLVFAYCFYYPRGGWNDFQESFSSKEDAINYAKGLLKGQYDFVDIVDFEKMDIILELSRNF